MSVAHEGLGEHATAYPSQDGPLLELVTPGSEEQTSELVSPVTYETTAETARLTEGTPDWRAMDIFRGAMVAQPYHTKKERKHLSYAAWHTANQFAAYFEMTGDEEFARIALEQFQNALDSATEPFQLANVYLGTAKLLARLQGNDPDARVALEHNLHLAVAQAVLIEDRKHRAGAQRFIDDVFEVAVKNGIDLTGDNALPAIERRLQGLREAHMGSLATRQNHSLPLEESTLPDGPQVDSTEPAQPPTPDLLPVIV